MGYSPLGYKESDTTESLHFYFHFPVSKIWIVGVGVEGQIIHVDKHEVI